MDKPWTTVDTAHSRAARAYQIGDCVFVGVWRLVDRRMSAEGGRLGEQRVCRRIFGLLPRFKEVADEALRASE